MGRVRLTTHIDAPPERVFALLAVPARVPEWRTSVREIANVTGPLDEAGTRFVTRLKGRMPAAPGEVARADPPRLLELRGGGGGFRYEAVARLEPVGGGTEITFENAYRLRGGPVGRIVDQIMAGRIEREMQADFARLKALAEREEP